MTREFLAGLNIEEGLIDKIMAEHGKAVQKYKDAAETDAETVKNLQGQLNTANDKIAAFENMDMEQIRQEAGEWKQKARLAEEKSKAEIETLKKQWLSSWLWVTKRMIRSWRLGCLTWTG